MGQQKQYVWNILTELGIPCDGFTRGHDYEIVSFKKEKEIIRHTPSFTLDSWVHDGKTFDDPENRFKTFLIKDSSYFIEVSYLQGIIRIDIYPDCNFKKLRSSLRLLVRQGFNHVQYPCLEIREWRECEDFDLWVDGSRKRTTIDFRPNWVEADKDKIKKVLLELLTGDYHIDSKEFAERYSYQRSLPQDAIKIYFPFSSKDPEDNQIFVVINRVCDPDKTLTFLRKNLK